MAAEKRKFYVVWEGREPGVYDTWEDCQEQVDGYPGAKYKSFSSQTAATIAFRGDTSEETKIIKAIAGQESTTSPSEGAGSSASSTSASPTPWLRFAEVNPAAIAVDGASAGNPGRMEYRGVSVADGHEIFHGGPWEQGTNNVAEYLALVHVLALLYQRGDSTTPVYTDSATARAWVRRRCHNSSLKRTPANAKVFELLQRADVWLHLHTFKNPILAWNTDAWGEIPADFGRK